MMFASIETVSFPFSPLSANTFLKVILIVLSSYLTTINHALYMKLTAGKATILLLSILLNFVLMLALYFKLYNH